MAGQLLEANGTRLFIDVRGSDNAPALLYIHGGPGMGCYDFMTAMADGLVARGLRVIGLDQRGVLRSDPLPDEPPLSVGLLVEDFEAIRRVLGVDRWAVLAHSAGGGYGLEYAVAHPGVVPAAVFDCPCWDADLTDRHRLPIAAERLEQRGEHEAAARCRELAAKPSRLTGDDDTRRAMQQLGPDYMALFFHDPGRSHVLDDAAKAADLSDDQWARGVSHLPLLAEMYTSRLDLLRDLTVPSLLVHGRDDLVAAPEALRRFRADVPQGVVHELAKSGHFPYHEEPEEYADVVAAFVAGHW